MESEIQTLIRRLKRAGLSFLLVLLIGMIGYRVLVEGSSWFEGLYMTFLTVTTIGFSEIVNLEDNVAGRIFTIFIAMSGIGILTYTVSNFAALIMESDFNKRSRQKKMEQRIQKLKNHYLICGASRVGLHIADELENTQRPFVVCDVDKESLEEKENLYHYGLIIEGDATEEDFLNRLGIQRARGVFVTTTNDHSNIVICVTARQLNSDLRIVAHCKAAENEKKLLLVGADKVISPAFIGGLRMASEMVRPTVTSFLDEMLRDTNLNLRIEEVTLPQQIEGKQLRELKLDDLDMTLVLAVKEKDHWKYNPASDYLLTANSQLIVMTSPEELRKLKNGLPH